MEKWSFSYVGKLNNFQKSEFAKIFFWLKIILIINDIIYNCNISPDGRTTLYEYNKIFYNTRTHMRNIKKKSVRQPAMAVKCARKRIIRTHTRAHTHISLTLPPSVCVCVCISFTHTHTASS